MKIINIRLVLANVNSRIEEKVSGCKRSSPQQKEARGNRRGNLSTEMIEKRGATRMNREL